MKRCKITYIKYRGPACVIRLLCSFQGPMISENGFCVFLNLISRTAEKEVICFAYIRRHGIATTWWQCVS